MKYLNIQALVLFKKTKVSMNLNALFLIYKLAELK